MSYLDDELARIEEEMNKRPVKDTLSGMSDRFTQKPWLIRHRENRRMSSWLSVVLQIISAMFGYYGAKVLMEVLPMPIPYAEYVGAFVGLATHEWFKRKFSDRFWDSLFAHKMRDRIYDVTGHQTGGVRWSAGVINVFLFAISIALTVGGGYFSSKDYGPGAQLVGASNDPEVQALKEERNRLRQEKTAQLASKAKHEANKVKDGNKMVISWPSQKAIATIETSVASIDQSITAITSTLSNKHGVYDVQNKDILKEWSIRSDYSIYSILFFLTLFELLFEGLMAFMSYYDVRLWIARKMQENQTGGKKKINGKKRPTVAV